MHFELIEARGAQFEVMRTSGDAPAVVVLPTSSGGARLYDEFLSELEVRGLPAMVINPRACGASTGMLEGLTFQDLAEDAIAVIEALVTRPVVLAGHAGGNRIARVAAIARPDLFSALVLLAAGGKMEPDREALTAVFRLGDPSLGDDERRRLIRTAFLASASDVRDSFLKPVDMSEDFARAFHAAAAAAPLEDWWDGGEGPVLVIQGKEDRMAPLANGYDLRERNPERVQVIDLDGAGHLIPMERPAETARLIAAFVRELATG